MALPTQGLELSDSDVAVFQMHLHSPAAAVATPCVRVSLMVFTPTKWFSLPFTDVSFAVMQPESMCLGVSAVTAPAGSHFLSPPQTFAEGRFSCLLLNPLL